MALSKQQAFNLCTDTAKYLTANYDSYQAIDRYEFARVAFGIMGVETGGKYEPKLKNKHSTAKGLMQVQDATKKNTETKFLGVKPAGASKMFEPRYNSLVGMAYLGYLYNRYDGVWQRAIIAYNQGHWDNANDNSSYYHKYFLKYYNDANYAELEGSAQDFAYVEYLEFP